MKKLLLFIFIIMNISCNQKNKYIGTWESVMSNSEINEYSSTTKDYCSFNNDTITYFYVDSDNISFSMVPNRNNFDIKDSTGKVINNVTIKDDTLLITFPNYTIFNSKWVKVNKTFKIDNYFKHFNNNFNKYFKYPLINIQTLGDGTLFVDCEMNSDSINMFKIEQLVKNFTDKELKMIPITEELGKFSRWQHAIGNIYKYENFNIKLVMENYFHYGDKSDDYTFNDEDYVEVKIWLNRK